MSFNSSDFGLFRLGCKICVEMTKLAKFGIGKVYTRILIVFFALSLFLLPATVEAGRDKFSTPEKLISWINQYRSNPEPTRVPIAVQAMNRLGLFKDLDKAGFLVGFIAGVLADNQTEAEILVANMLPIPPKEQAIIIRAIAYSGLPEWRTILQNLKPQLPMRHHLINQYLSGEKKSLKELSLDGSPDILDTLWGYYAATGFYDPVIQIITALKWSKTKQDFESPSWKSMMSALSWNKDKNDVERVTIGNMAKWTLASNAERDRDLIGLYKVELESSSETVRPVLQEVINSAERFEADELRKDALAAIQEVKRRNPEGKAPWSTASYAGSLAISTACVIAGATGHAEIAAPCIISGALYSGAVKFLNATR